MSNPNHYPELEERQRAARAVELKTTGMTYAAVAVELGYADESGARKAVSRLLSRIEHEGVSELRAIECARLDALTAAHWKAAIGGDVDASKVVLQVIDRRAKLLGLNAPTRVQVAPDEVTGTEFAERAAELIAELRPDTLRRAFATTPEAAAVFDAGRQNGLTEGQGSTELVSGGRMVHRDEIGSVAADDADVWSNIGAAAHVSESQSDLEPELESEPQPKPIMSAQRRVPVAAQVDQAQLWQRRLGDRYP